MRILVTGTTGYLGANFCEFFNHSKKFKIELLVRKAPSYLKNWLKDYTVNFGDISNKDSLTRIFSTKKFDAIIHFAAVNETICSKDIKEAIRVNGFGTKNILDVSEKFGVKKFIYISTFHVYGQPIEAKITENSPCSPLNNYGISKLLGELFVLQKGIGGVTESLILRLSNGFGPPINKNINRWSLVVNDLCRQAVLFNQLNLKTAGNQKRDFICMEDIFQAITLFINHKSKKEKSGIYNVGSGKAMSILGMAQLIQKVYEKEYGKKIPINIMDKRKQTSLTSFRFNCDKIKSLGFKPKNNFYKAILETIKIAKNLNNEEEAGGHSRSGSSRNNFGV